MHNDTTNVHFAIKITGLARGMMQQNVNYINKKANM